MPGKLLVVGSVALDSVEAPAGRRDDILGGSASFFTTAASYFVSPIHVAHRPRRSFRASTSALEYASAVVTSCGCFAR